MFRKIMIPVDLAHTDQMTKALSVAGDLAKHQGAELHVVGVTMSGPTSLAKSPTEFREKLELFAQEQGGTLGRPLIAHAEISNDLRIDLDAVLEQTATKIGADLVIMASHVPGLAEHVFASNAGYLAAHSKLSVLVVR